MTIRILVVDDAKMMRRVLARRLSQEPDFEVIGTAADAYEARDILVRERPDVVTLDLGLPRLDGLSFLRKYMEVIPTPTIVVSAATGRDRRLAVAAIAAGAVGVLSKEQLFGDGSMGAQLADEIRTAAAAAVSKGPQPSIAPPPRRARVTVKGVRRRLLAIGASTGGVVATQALLEDIPEDAPPIVVAQHMPAGFTGALADRLDKILPLRVEEAVDGRPLEDGLVLIAPGGHHLEVRAGAGGLVAYVHDGPRVSHHRPSVDTLFSSVAKAVGADAAGALLTGMGHDGAQGLKEMRDQGALTVAQDEATCVVYGMPGAAVRLGAAVHEVPLERIAHLLMSDASVTQARPA